ncbi:hypothetical protein ACQEU6_46350 [Spirillospora sp. CA-108201]
MIDPRLASAFLLPNVPLAALGGVFSGLAEAGHHNWFMGVLGGLCVSVAVMIFSVYLVLLDGSLEGRRPRYLLWGCLALATVAAFLAGMSVLSELAWPMRWGLSLLCLLPLLLTRAALRTARDHDRA